LRRNLRRKELAQQVGGGIVREAQTGRSEVLIENRRAQEVRHLLLFDGVARCSQDVTAAVEDGAGSAALEQL